MGEERIVRREEQAIGQSDSVGTILDHGSSAWEHGKRDHGQERPTIVSKRRSNDPGVRTVLLTYEKKSPCTNAKLPSAVSVEEYEEQ